MSHQRSTILFLTLIAMVAYLYYESPAKKEAQQNLLDFENKSVGIEIEKSQVLHRRSLLSFSSDEPHKGTYVPTHMRSSNETIEQGHKYKVLNYISPSSPLKTRKRLKREAVGGEDFFNWKFNVNVTKLGNETGIASVKHTKESKKEKSLSLAVFVEGNGPKDSYEELQGAWSSVGKFLKNFFGSTRQELKEHKVVVDTHGFSDIIKQTNDANESLFEKKEGWSQKSKGRNPKFLSIFFGAGGNKEKPLLELGSGEVEEDGSPAGIMKDLPSITTIKNTEVSDNSILLALTTENPSVFELESFKIPSSTVDHASSTDTTSTVTSAVSSAMTSSTMDFNSFTATSGSLIDTNTLPVIASSTDVPPVVITENSADEIKALCTFLLRNTRKVPRFIDEFSDSSGSGSLVVHKNIEDTKLSVPETEHINEVVNTMQPQKGLIQSIWDRIRNIGFRNSRSVDEIIDISATAKHSKDVKNGRFTNALLSGFGSGRLDPDTEVFDFIAGSITDQNLIGLSMKDCKDFFESENSFTTKKQLALHNEIETLSGHEVPLPVTPTDEVSFSTLKIIPEIETQSDLKALHITAESFITDVVQPKSIFEELKVTTNAILVSSSLPHPVTENPIGHSVTPINSEVNLFTSTRKPTDSNLQMQERSPDSIILKEIEIDEDEIKLSTSAHFGENTEKPKALIPEDRSFFNNLNSDDSILELGSSDERSLFNNLLGSGQRELDENTDFLATTTLISPLDPGGRFFLGLMDIGSGSREISDTEISTEEDNIDINTKNQNKEKSFSTFFDLGSGVRNLNEVESTTDSEVIFPMSEAFKSDFSTFESLSETSIEREKQGVIDSKSTTVDPNSKTSDRSIFDKSLGSGDVPELETEEHNIFKSIFNILGSGDGRDIPETNINLTDFEKQTNCRNCSSTSFNCDGCDDQISENNSSLFQNDTIALSRTHSETVSEPVLCLDCDESDENNARSERTFPLSTSDHQILVSGTVEDASIKPDPNMGDDCSHCDLAVSVNSDKPEKSMSMITTLQPLATILNNINRKGEELTTSIPLLESGSSIGSLDILKETNLTEESNSTNSRILDQLFNGSEVVGIHDNGQIHFLPEPESSTQSPSSPVSRRGARLHDDVLPLDWPDLVTTEAELVYQNTQSSVLTSSSSDNTHITEATTEYISELFSTSNIMNITDSVLITEIITKQNTFKTENQDGLKTLAPTTITERDLIAPTTVSLGSSRQSIQSTPVHTTEKALNPEFHVIPSVPGMRFCTSASECNTSLNERCISNDDIATCDCGRAFRRHPVSRKCEATVTLKTSLHLPGERFHPDLRKRDSAIYQKKKRDSEETMWLLLRNDPKLYKTVAGVDVAGFEEGSLIVNWDLKMLTEGNETVSEFIEEIDKDLKEVLGNDTLLQNLPLNVRNASGHTSAPNQCENAELNYCHKNAKCILDEDDGFRCQCKDGYLDNSKEKMYPGEVCIAFCFPGYCGDHGDCQLKLNGDKHCLCNGWYFGERCEISGIVVIASFAGANVLIIFIVLILVCVCKQRRRHGVSFYNRNVTEFQPGQEFGSQRMSRRVGDAIAMNDVGPGKMSKFVTISTPVFNQAPVIQVTSPSFPGSSIDYDSTFDRSQCFSDLNNTYDAVAKDV